MIDIIIRKEITDDFDFIKNLNNKAFHQKHEGELIENLRKRPEYISELSLLAVFDNKIIGHILFFPVTIVTPGDAYTTLSLAPMAVLPDFQKIGIGEKLIIEGLERAKSLGFASAVVLGHPEYYPRFGFRPASAWKIKAPFSVPDEAMMAIELIEGSLDFGGGNIDFPKDYYEAL